MRWLNRFRDPQWASPVATHQPVLWEIANRSSLPILEFGCGEGSTKMLHHVSESRGVPLITFETDPEWMARYTHDMETSLHQFRLVSGWESELASSEWDDYRCGLVFVDQTPWEARVTTIERFRLTAEYVILHDSVYYPVTGLMGKSVRDLVGPADVGVRTYDDMFTSYKEFFPQEPWPLPDGPSTLLGSNFHDCDIAIDLAALSPPRWARRPILGYHAAAGRVGRSLRSIGRSGQ